MTEQDQIKAIAELDGWTIKSRQCPHSGSVMEHYWFSPDDQITPKINCSTQTLSPSGNVVGHVCGDSVIKLLPKYLASYDAIIPVIQKQVLSIQIKILSNLYGRLEETWLTAEVCCLFNSTPPQLCEALLRSTGKWKA